MGQLTNLTSLDLSRNTLCGSFPCVVGQLLQLKFLDLSQNQLTGVIPPSLGNLLQSLESLLLGSNHLTGQVPAVLLRLPKLGVFNATSNMLTGPVPPLFNATSLGVFQLSDNPGLYVEDDWDAASWLGGGLASLTVLEMQRVRLPADFMSSLPHLPRLVNLDVSGTSLSGTMDADISAQLPALLNLIVHSNRLTGPMPALPPALQALIAFDNDFTHIPPLEQMHNLTYVVLDGNRRMGGQLHDDWSALSKLQVLSAQHCSLSGSIPPGLLQLSMEGQLHTIGLRDNLLRGPIVLPAPSNGSSRSSMAALDIGMNAIDGRIPAAMHEYMALAPALSVLRLDQNLLSCGLGGFDDVSRHGALAGGGVSVLPGNSFECPVPSALGALDPAAEAYTCSSAPWQLDMVAAAVACVCVLGALGLLASSTRNTGAGTSWSSAVEFCRCTCIAATSWLLCAFVASVIHWGALYPSVYACAGGLWGSGAYHREGSGALLFVTLAALAWVQMHRISYAAAAAPRYAAVEEVAGGRTTQTVRGISAGQPGGNPHAGFNLGAGFIIYCESGFILLLLLSLFVSLNLGLDVLLVMLSADAWGIRGKLGIPHLLTLAIAVTAILKTAINSVVLPMVARSVFGSTSVQGTLCCPVKSRIQGRPARSAQWYSPGTFMTVLQVVLSTLVPLLVALVQLQECFAYRMPWNTPALLPVSYQYVDCAEFCPPDDSSPECFQPYDVLQCSLRRNVTGSANIQAPPLWRGTCSSAAYALFAPQATLMLAIQAVQVLVLATIQWRSKRTVGQMTSAAQHAMLQQARRKGCCGVCYRAPTDRAAWMPQQGQRVHVRSTNTPQEHSLHTPLIYVPGVEIALTGQLPGGQPAGGNEAAAGSKATNAGHVADEHSSYSSSHWPTFDSIQAHITLLVGGVFGAVYPAACLACAAAVGAYTLSWRLAPHAQGGDVPVPVWMRGAMVLVYTASVWFAYGPGSMLEGGSADGALVALGCVTALSVCLLAWMAVPAGVQARLAVLAGGASGALAACCCRGRGCSTDAASAPQV